MFTKSPLPEALLCLLRCRIPPFPPQRARDFAPKPASGFDLVSVGISYRSFWLPSFQPQRRVQASPFQLLHLLINVAVKIIYERNLLKAVFYNINIKKKTLSLFNVFDKKDKNI